MFGWVDLREDEKKKEWKIGKKMSKRVVWLGGREREREREIVGLDCFSSGPPKLHLPKWGEKRSENVVQNFGLKCPLTKVSVVRFCFFFFFFFSFFFCASFASINSYFLVTGLFCFLRC